jgi:hypothetical protein
MSALKNTNQKASTSSRNEHKASLEGSRNRETKLAGTRVGTLNDLRGGSTNGRSERSQHGKRLRDGQ